MDHTCRDGQAPHTVHRPNRKDDHRPRASEQFRAATATALGHPVFARAHWPSRDQHRAYGYEPRLQRAGTGLSNRYKFVYYYLVSIVELLNELGTGTTFKELSGGKLKELPIPVPPLPEQRRIVAILDEAFEGIATAKANAEKNLQNAREWADRQLAIVLRAASATDRPQTLQTLVAPGCTLSYGIVQPGDDVPGGLPVVRPVDLGAKRVRVEGLKCIDPALAGSYARTTLEGGDLLLCVRGTTGTVAVAELALAGANVTRGIVPIRFDSKIVIQSLGYYLLRSEPVQAQIRARTYGTALMQINIRDLRRIALSFPPLERQAAIVERLDAAQEAADQLAGICERKLAALDDLKKSLLHQAFTGAL